MIYETLGGNPRRERYKARLLSFFQKRKQDVNISHLRCNHVVFSVGLAVPLAITIIDKPQINPFDLASTIAPPYQHIILSTITD
jgi:hypothetical protein